MNEKLINFLKQSIEFFKNLVRNDKNKKESNEALQSDLLNKTKPMIKTKALSIKTTSKLSAEELNALPQATQEEVNAFFDNIAKKDYQNTPEVLKIGELNDALKALINHNNNANVFITRARGAHISEARKDQYSQALRLEEQKEIPSVLQQAKQAYTGEGEGFVIPFKDATNESKINLIVLNSDEKGNFLITAKKVDKVSFNAKKYKKLERAGVEPAIIAEKLQKPTEATPQSSYEGIITQNTNSFYSKFKNWLKNIDNNLAKEKENPKDTQELKDTEHHKRRQK